MKKQVIGCMLVVLALCGSAVAVTTDLTPLTVVADESGFGTLYAELEPQAFSS